MSGIKTKNSVFASCGRGNPHRIIVVFARRSRGNPELRHKRIVDGSTRYVTGLLRRLAKTDDDDDERRKMLLGCFVRSQRRMMTTMKDERRFWIASCARKDGWRLRRMTQRRIMTK